VFLAQLVLAFAFHEVLGGVDELPGVNYLELSATTIVSGAVGR